ncbi:MAG TPA: ATP-binding protein [Mesorhizobium sp.]|nr:ATP-binding protein [Mesorhizobium sp.]
MRRLLPKSLGGQLAALLIAGLLSAHLVSLLVFSGERSRAVEAAARFGVVERIAALVEVIDDASPELGERLAGALSTRRTRLALDAQSSLAPDGMTAAELNFAGQLAEELSLGDRRARVRFTQGAPPEPERASRRRRTITNVAISIPLSDGRWLNAASSFRTPRVDWSWPWLVSLAVSAATTLAVVALAVGRITRPMRALALAAEQVGRGEATAPVPPRGPAELRTTVEAFNAMQARLSRFVRDRTRMVAAISHDLRTPITSLRLRAEFIEDEELKGDVIRTLDEMQAMANAVLAFAREEGSGEETRSVDLAALLEGLAEDHAALGHDVAYVGPERLAWRCRPLSLKRAVGNLVENAVRYAGSARVTLSQSGAEALIGVEDGGPGIPDARVEEVFEPFVRLETSRSRETGGVGLGLSIARSIIRAHGGELTLTNKGEGGLKATATLP